MSNGERLEGRHRAIIVCLVDIKLFIIIRQRLEGGIGTKLIGFELTHCVVAADRTNRKSIEWEPRFGPNTFFGFPAGGIGCLPFDWSFLPVLI